MNTSLDGKRKAKRSIRPGETKRNGTRRRCIQADHAGERTAALAGGACELCVRALGAEGRVGQSDLPNIRFHDLRHTVATLMINHEVPITVVAQILARIMIKHRVIFVTRPEIRDLILDMKLDYAESLDTAMSAAFVDFDHNPSVTVITNGISVIIESVGISNTEVFY